MPFSNWSPKNVAVRYNVECRGNDVYRVSKAKILDQVPKRERKDCTLFSGLTHLEDALASLGISTDGTWCGFVEEVADTASGLNGLEFEYTCWIAA